jgi:hypothetical protein
MTKNTNPGGRHRPCVKSSCVGLVVAPLCPSGPCRHCPLPQPCGGVGVGLTVVVLVLLWCGHPDGADIIIHISKEICGSEILHR